MIEQIENVREAFEKIWEAVGNWDLREGGRRDLGNRDSGRECGRQNRDSGRREKQVMPSNWEVTPRRGAARKETRLVDADHDLKNCLILLWQVYFNAFGTWALRLCNLSHSLRMIAHSLFSRWMVHFILYCITVLKEIFCLFQKLIWKNLVYHCQWH